MDRTHASARSSARATAGIIVVIIGITLLACALAADRRRLDRHFLPSFFVPRRAYVVVASMARIALAALGTLAILRRSRIGRFIADVPPRKLAGQVARVTLAIALALGTAELVLRRTFKRSSEEQSASQEPRRRLDQRLGWVFVPARTGRDTVDGRMIEYAFDPTGYRVRRVGEPVDPTRPTILFTGESIMVGQV